MYKCIAVFTIVAFQLLGRGVCASNLRVAQASVFYEIMDHVDSLSVAEVAELYVEASNDVGYKHYSPFERCCLLNRMAGLVFDYGLLYVLEKVRHDCPERSAEIIDGILNFVDDCRDIFEFRYESPPARSWGALKGEFINILDMPLVDGSHSLDERMAAVCHDVGGLLLNECSSRLADTLLHGDIALCRGDVAIDCAEKFYEKSRRSHRRLRRGRTPGRVFLAGPLGDVAAQISEARHCRYRPLRDNPAVSEAVKSFGERYRDPGDLLTMHGVPTDVRDDVQLIVEHSIRERLCWAVFPGTETAYNRSIGDVLNSVWIGNPNHHIWLDGPTFQHLRPDDDGIAPLHRFWCWIDAVLAAERRCDFTELVLYARDYCEDFDQIAFDQFAYGNCLLVFTWLVLREILYPGFCDCDPAPPCCFDPEYGESVFRLTPGYMLPPRYLCQLLAICRRWGGPTWDAIRRDSERYLLPRWKASNGEVARTWEELLSTAPQKARFYGGR